VTNCKGIIRESMKSIRTAPRARCISLMTKDNDNSYQPIASISYEEKLEIDGLRKFASNLPVNFCDHPSCQ
jgi:hypothetical protein